MACEEGQHDRRLIVGIETISMLLRDPTMGGTQSINSSLTSIPGFESSRPSPAAHADLPHQSAGSDSFRKDFLPF